MPEEQDLLTRITASPAFMTWGNMIAKSSVILLVAPLAISRLSAEDAVLWLLFNSVYVFLMLVFDLGLTLTFTRLISYGHSGLTLEDLGRIHEDKAERGSGTPCWPTIYHVIRAKKRIYAVAALLTLILAATGGTAAAYRFITMSSSPGHSWIAWAVIVLTAPIAIYGYSFGARLQGIQKVALWQRTQMFFSLGAGLSTATALLIVPDLLIAVCVFYVWVVLQAIYAARLSKKHLGDLAGKPAGNQQDDVSFGQIWRVVWPPSWRSGLGVLMSAALTQLSGIIYAQIGTTGSVAGYLLALQVIRAVSSFSQAPFSSKIPRLSAVYAVKDQAELLRLARRGMRLTYVVFLAGFAVVGFFIDPALDLIGAKVSFPAAPLWSVLGIAFFAERYGAMHIQLYSVTNNIIWHKANGVSGLITITATALLYGTYGILAYPLGLALGYVCFYSWYSASHSYRFLGTNVWRFERACAFPALLAMLLLSLAIVSLVRAQ